MRVVVETKLSAVDRDAWNALIAQSTVSAVFQSYEWHAAWLRACGEGVELFIVCVYEGSALLGVGPFMITRHERGARHVRFIADERADYADMLCAAGRDDVRTAIMDALAAGKAGWDTLELNNIPEHSLTNVFWHSYTRRMAWPAVWGKRLPCPTMKIAGQEAFVVQAMNKKSLKRHARYFRERGDLSADHRRDKDAIHQELNSFFAQHIHRWSGREAQSLFLDRKNRDFYRYLVDELAPAGKILFTSLVSCGEPVAYHFGFIDGDRLLWYKPAFDIGLAEHYPGEVLIRELIAFARAQGFSELDFTRGDEFFKTRFSNEVRYNRSVRIFKRKRDMAAWAMRRFFDGNGPVLWALKFLREVFVTCRDVLYARRIVEQSRQAGTHALTPEAYHDDAVQVSQYRNAIGLQKPEMAILRYLRPELKGMRVLDIGAGAGRTSVYFGTAAGEYLAFDHAPHMVEAGRRAVGDIVPPGSFLEGDARRMSFVDDKSCDLVLWSYNGIDGLDEDARFSVFREVRRVGRLGAWFCFSSHNIQSLGIWGLVAPGMFLRRLRRYVLYREANKGLERFHGKDSGMVFDAWGHYQIPIYYIAPEAQVIQLKECGFRDVRVYSLETGREVRDAGGRSRMTDSWVYYLCRI
ncbi:MAG: GNAT family N-acetyltransferase [Candidatus Omnitrophica bacterium]|nr:GNAT family N-acetyltransferase [Candidatus Omnitrophota bacterium]